MGCTASKPTTPEPVDAQAKAEAGRDGNGRQGLRGDSGHSNNSRQRRNRNNQSTSSDNNSQSKGSSVTSKHNGYHGGSNKRSATGGGNSSVGSSSQNSHGRMNGSSAGHGPKSKGDPYWTDLWETHQALLIDPADVHSAIEDLMGKATNKLSATELTFLQRKVRAIVRSSTQQAEAVKGGRMGRILNNNNNNSEEQETRAMAGRYHLLTNHVVRKLLPKPPSSTPASINTLETTYILALFLHESMWDGVAEIAAASTKDVGLVMDVNKHEPLTTAPAPCSPRLSEVPEVPPGVSFHAVACLMGLALRGTRVQKLQLLFYLLLPPYALTKFLEKHPAGGVPVWLLEVGNKTILSLASLAHYYWYGDAFLPGRETDSEKARTPPERDLTINGKDMFTFLKSLLTPSSSPPKKSTNQAPNNGLRDSNSSNDNKLSSPVRKNAPLVMRRRASFNSAETEENPQPSFQSDVMDRLQQDEKEETAFVLEDYIGDLAETRDRFMNISRPPDTCTMPDFYKWANNALDNSALDAIMHRLFAHGTLPSPSVEAELVKMRWRDWQESEYILWKKFSAPEGTLELLTQSVRKILYLQQNGDGDAPKQPPRRAFGGIGGFDGRGAIGFGVMYCIDKSWWDKWQSYVRWSWAGDDKPTPTHRTLERPGELSTEPLLRRLDDDIVAGTYGSYELMHPGLEKDTDYVLVPPAVWDILYEIYGGGPPLPRMILPPKTSEATVINPSSTSEDVDIELRNVPNSSDADTNAPDDATDRVMRIPRLMEVETHPWVLHVHLCDPQQPYRRGDAGPMSIRVMALPDQPLWRMYAEIVVRLPFHLYKAYGPDGRGKARFWKRIDPSGPKDALTRYGPWTLLCKNRQALLPGQNLAEELDEHYDELKSNWEAYADMASVESIGLGDGDQIMVECAVLNRIGDFIWPREAAAKAGRARRLADKDIKFKRMLRGLDDNGKVLADPPNLVGVAVDAMDASGRWYEVKIAQVQSVVPDTDDEEDSMEMESADGFGSGRQQANHQYDRRKDGGEQKQVRVDFSEHGGHSEWIDVESDRLATVGRFTLGKDEDSPDTPAKTAANGNGQTDGKGKAQAQVKKAVPESVPENNGKVCTIPGYGACGLMNLGNTCYANSAIQCVSYLPLLRAYLLSAQYKATGDLNKDNPLGTGGKLLEEFAELLRLMWSARAGEKSPTRFRMQLGKANPQFSGADQQDAQEFLNFLLDVLHEDSNRVRRKPYVEGLEDEWVKKTSLPRVGEEAWRRFLRRNRSIMADVAMGQVLNTVTCPHCNFSSRNFDPFNLLSIPFPTVADVIFKCYVVRRANAYNTPWVLNKPRKGEKYKNRFKTRDMLLNPKPPSEQLIVEQYIIAMSRLADSGDLKLQIQNICGIPANEIRLCRAEEVSIQSKDDNSVVRRQTQVTLLTDKEGPCSQFARQRANSEDLGAAPSSPSLIVAFESTLRSRPSDDKKSEEDSSDSNGDDEEDDEQDKSVGPSKKELIDIEKQVAVYGNVEECRLYDTDTVPIAKAISRSLWPRKEEELKLGLRADALDQRDHWFPGSVVEILESEANGESKEADGAKTRVRIHFDNFSSKWDLLYTIDDFFEGKVRPLYSHTAPRAKPTEFAVHHRYTDRGTRLSNLFGQTFYVQCHNEWSTARAGAQILSQASRFLRQATDSSTSRSQQKGPDPPTSPSEAVANDGAQDREQKVQRLYERTQTVISDLIDLLIDCDREYVHQSLGVTTDSNPNDPPGTKAERFRNPGFDATALSSSLVKRVNALLHRLPFEVRVCTVDSPLGGTNEEVAFPFSLMRTIGNYMNVRHAVVLQWREPPSDKKASGGRHSNYLGAPVMYVPPKVSVDEISAEILNKANMKSKRSSTNHGSAGLQLGVCLSEFCKVQQLSISDNWRCPICKEYREGKQNLALWRLPDLLTFHIKRFNCSARWREKITTKVNFPLTGLDMQEWCHEESPVLQNDSGDSYVYDLIGVLNHYGGMTGGHYVATCKATACGRDGHEEVAHDFHGGGTSKPMVSDDDSEAQPGWRIGRQKTEVNQNKVTAALTSKAVADSSEPLWLQFDDDLVEPIPPRHVVSEMAYVLFYRRRRLTPSNIARYSTLE